MKVKTIKLPESMTKIQPDTANQPTKRKKRCYVAGPVRNNPNFREQFATAKAALLKQGFDVISPIDVEDAMGLSYMTNREIMNLGIALCSLCDCIAMIPGHENAKGCKMELAYAIANNMPVIELEESD